jgi:predicted TIM-barrel fold metal-dependent hydrolase
MSDTLPIIAVEEHLAVPELSARLDAPALSLDQWPWPGGPPALLRNRAPQLADTGAGRLTAMDEAGIAIQVLSFADAIPRFAGSAAHARARNDRLSAIIASEPKRFAGFACLATHSPEEAADELERSVRDLGLCGALIPGTVEGRFLDDPCFAPLLRRAETLGVPLFLHPGLPPEPLQKAYYSGLPHNMGFILGTYGWGWHAEVALHALRLVVSGTLDRHPRLQLIIGHMGEGLPAMMERIDQSFAPEAAHLASLPSDYLRKHFNVAISGFCSVGGFNTLVDSFGEDRVVFAADYPMTNLPAAVGFLRSRALPTATLHKIAWGNAARLLGLSVPQTKQVGSGR